MFSLCQAKEGMLQARWKGFYSFQEAQEWLLLQLKEEYRITIEEERDNRPIADTEESIEHTLMSINLILQELHLKEGKLREIREDFDELLEPNNEVGIHE